MLDVDGEPHLMDFGLARRQVGDTTMTVEGRVMGTPAYMSPEQARGEAHRADCRTDIYSLGVVLFRLLTRELPFRGNAQMLIMQILRDEPPSPRKLDSRVTRDLETITLKCLEKNPDHRYRSAAKLAAELRRFARGEPINARPYFAYLQIPLRAALSASGCSPPSQSRLVIPDDRPTDRGRGILPERCKAP
jgi:serine/threonine protein kinase